MLFFLIPTTNRQPFALYCLSIMKKISPFSVLFAVLTLMSACKYETYFDKIQRQAKEYTELKCPYHIDEYTIMDSKEFSIEDTTLIFNYTVRDKLDDKSIYTSLLIEEFREKTLMSLKGDLSSKAMKEKGIKFSYRYRSESSGETLLDITFTREDYE